VYGYAANSAGQLSAISGSPFKPGTQIIGGTTSQFITLGKTLIHSYALGSNGALQSQESQIPFLNYSGNSCGGGTNGLSSAVLDHSGQYVYVLLQNGGDGTCSAYQTYKINSDGSFTFDGDTEVSVPSGAGTGNPSILGNETFAYANEWVGHYSNLNGFRRQSSGTLDLMQFAETDPPPCTTCSPGYLPAYPDASPTGNYVVVQLYPDNGGGDSNPPQLGSYTVDSNGNISTTNTPSNMPTTQLTDPASTFSPDGKMFALYADAQNGAGHLGNGIEIYNFNGAAPLTLNTTLLNGTPIDQVAWDTSGHLYALSRSEGKLWVFNVTPTSVAQTASMSIGMPSSMVVVSQTAGTGGGGGACSTPAAEGVNVCSPDENASVASPVQINAAANVTGGVYRFELWSGNTKLASVSNSGILNQSLPLAAGTYHLTFDARNSAGNHVYAYRDITVTGGSSACAAPSSYGINVCSPAEGATVSSPVQIKAAATISGGIYRFSLWNGNTKLLSEDNGTIDQTVSLAPGSYKLTFDARNSSGTHEYATRDITVGAGGGGLPTQYDAPLLVITGPSADQDHGQVTIDTSGNTTVQVTGQAANVSYTVQFCPAVDTNTHPTVPPCFDITTVSTNGSGNGSSTVKFPKSGNWAGEFSLLDSSGTTVLQTWMDPESPTFNALTYMSTLLPETTTNGSAVAPSTGQLPLTSGTVSVSNGTAVFTVKGASPSASYSEVEHNGRYLYTSDSYGLVPGFTTNSAGDGSGSVTLATQGTEGGDMFTVEGPAYSPSGYVGGFSIP
jgi:hypothetical protein